ncbi:MAG: glycosyltransferase family 4 protein, partial [Bacteroidetes bacterium]|nr:glycosyltransferase family 4 protein [Bacteroidota bacterium]
MRILVLTQYFPPEVGAPQNRLFELAVRLQKSGADITVLTAMPNYPKMEISSEYIGKYYSFEEMEGLKVHRSWIYVSKDKSIIKRLLNYFSFVISSFFIGMFKMGKFDYIICESPPLFLGISAFFLKILKRSKLIFNVSDLWPESAEKLGLVSNRFLLSLSTKLEEFLYRNSAIISGQTQGIVNNISQRFPKKVVYWLPNGVDMNFYDISKINSDWRSINKFKESDFILLYAGIIGHAQGLEIILNAADKLKSFAEIKFVILGNGPEKDSLLKLKEELNAANVYFFDSVSKAQMPHIVKAIDASIVPLKKLDLFKGAIPSKIFENLAMKKPIILGVEGEAKELFIDEGKSGLAFEPENASDLAEKILMLYKNQDLIIQFGENGYNY